MVVLVAVVRLDEFHLLRQIAHAGDGERSDLDRAEMFRVPSGLAASPARAAQAELGHERGLGLEGIQIEMKRKRVERTGG
ncbi:MAG: hypothetical protein DMG21_02010 [Acidobacteria bacterium]|nr:MAG: hypothetical protein DMG21_02010 [Acidobacteriota bacterium]